MLEKSLVHSDAGLMNWFHPRYTDLLEQVNTYWNNFDIEHGVGAGADAGAGAEPMDLDVEPGEQQGDELPTYEQQDIMNEVNEVFAHIRHMMDWGEPPEDVLADWAEVQADQDLNQAIGNAGLMNWFLQRFTELNEQVNTYWEDFYVEPEEGAGAGPMDVDPGGQGGHESDYSYSSSDFYPSYQPPYDDSSSSMDDSSDDEEQ